MRVLFISTWFPFPLDTGSRIRVHHLLRTLARRNQVHLIAFVPRAEDMAFVPAVESWGVQVDAVCRDPFWRDPRKAFLGYLSARPRDVVAGYSPEMARLVVEAMRGQRYDAVVASVVNAAPYALLLEGTPRILEEHNFMTGWMEELYRTQRGLAHKASRWRTWQKCRRYERWLYPHFEACTMVSEQDRTAVRATIHDYPGRVEVIPNGVDLERNVLSLAEPAPNTLVFNGALTYHANADAMRFFVGEILPQIRAQLPSVALKITGRSDGVDTSWLPPGGAVTLTGYLDDVRPTVAGSWACVVPMRIGGGTRLKILEAMALGTPVISTSKGAEGLEVTPERDMLIADDPALFARQVLRLLEDVDFRQRLSENGRRLVEARYGWQEIGQGFCALVDSVVYSGGVRR